MIKRLLSGKQPEPTTEPQGWFQKQVYPVVQQKIDDMPIIQQGRKYWEKLEKERGWWPVLLPLLAWVGWSTYRKERRKVLQERAAAAEAAAAEKAGE